MNNKLTIPISTLSIRGVIQEKPDSFGNSFFADVYSQSLKVIAQIINNNENEERFPKQLDKPYFVQNTIAFSGRRGTGKTSVMNTVCNYLLKNRPGNDEYCDAVTKETIDKTEFYSIPQMIDASHLDQNEDLLEVIIAYLIKGLKDMKESPVFDEELHGIVVENLNRELAKMQNDYDSLLQTSNKSIATSYDLLIKGADKHLIQHKFKKIIDEYLELQSYYSKSKSDYRKNKKYLIICIDDIDMYSGDPMQIMQCVYRYFMLPNTIVLTSLNFKLLSTYIYRHYYSKLFSEKEKDLYFIISKRAESIRKETCLEQSNAYIRKIIPIDMRIVMPSWKKSDYKDLIKKEILLNDTNLTKSFEDTFPSLIPGRFYMNIIRKINKKDYLMSVKDFIFQLLADRTGIYLDPIGYKAHFMEPDSLRSMADIFSTLYSMNNIRENGPNSKKYIKENEDKIRQNYKTILDTFYFKILPDLHLEDRESNVFESICRETITRRNKMIIDHYQLLNMERHNLYDSTEDSDKKTSTTDSLPYSHKSDYSIGELFKVLHHSTRNNFFSKDMVKAILASYSFKLPYMYDKGIFLYEEKKNIYEESQNEIGIYNNPFQNREFKPLFEVFGDSLLGSWTSELFRGKRLRWYIDADKFRFSNKDDIIILIRSLLFVRLEKLKTNEHISFIKLDNNSDKKYYIKYDLDPTAFLINIIRFDEFESAVRKSLNFLDKESDKNVETVFSEFHTKIKNIVLRKNDKPNYANNIIYPLFPFPIHQVDIAYNVIKRAIKDIIYVSDSSLDIEMDNNINNEPLTIMKAFYQNIIIELTKIRKCYPLFNNETESDEQDQNVFSKMFARSGEVLNLWDLEKPTNKAEIPYDYKIKQMTENDKIIFVLLPKENDSYVENVKPLVLSGNNVEECSLEEIYKSPNALYC